MLKGIKALVIKSILEIVLIYSPTTIGALIFLIFLPFPNRGIPFLCFHINGDMKDFVLN